MQHKYLISIANNNRVYLVPMDKHQRISRFDFSPDTFGYQKQYI